MHPAPAASEAEIALLVAEILKRSGHDFRQYSRDSRRRRILAFLGAERLATVAQALVRLAADPTCLARLLNAMSVPVTAMFRDAAVFHAIRTTVLPRLAAHPVIRVWLAGCASGEEAWSLAILLHEAGLYERSCIYATDMNTAAIASARAGIFPMATMRENIIAYHCSGGGDFSQYYTAAYGFAKFDAALARRMVFAQHNLAIDGSFNEFQLILCRNVLIYFDAELQIRVHRLLHDSLAAQGVLCLGLRESMRPNPDAHRYAVLDAAHRLYQRKQGP
jgi:chemotaxis protein methyltransferase CheR